MRLFRNADANTCSQHETDGEESMSQVRILDVVSCGHVDMRLTGATFAETAQRLGS
ncbi:hypothetical protein [Novosphingobium kaempferiae]|uniref:hypothetical protein n=1 Tax=Novosphingobium kaempferiae TaxID=2896849 RepID=UPI001E3FF8E1|nr:hypothetical protein [Novosphingobium kaempferiae]